MNENTIYICVMVDGVYTIEGNLSSEIDSCYQIDSRPCTVSDMDVAEF